MEQLLGLLCLISLVFLLACVDKRLAVGIIAMIVALVIINVIWPSSFEPADPRWCVTGNCCRDMDGNWGPCH